jgi:hypothetical protein
MPQRWWLRRLCLGALAGLLVLAGVRAAADNETSEARMRRDITYLASDECEGRGPGTKGIDLAAQYIAEQFKKAGLKPGGPDGSYFQPFKISSGPGRLVGTGELVLRGPLGQTIQLRPGQDFTAIGGNGNNIVSAPLVFAAHGVVAPKLEYDDYKGLDVAGKIVVLLRRVPRWDNKDTPFGGSEGEKARLAALTTKFNTAAARKAAAVLLVNNSADVPEGDELIDFEAMPLGSVPLPVFHVRRAALDPVLLSSLGKGVRELEEDINRDLKAHGAPLPEWSARLDATMDREPFAVKNVIGVLEGAGPLADETVVVGAHYDHLGYGGWGSLAGKTNKKQIHHGADDNGSGTTGVIELARRFGALKDRQGRRIVFMTFAGEERGLLGSAHYCNKDPQFPLEKTVAMVNLDMIGRLRPDKKSGKDRLIVEGVQTAKEFEDLIERFNKKHGFTLTKRAGNSPYSDHASFYRKKVPILFLWTDTHENYHKPSDTADRINVKGMRQITDLAEELLTHFATVAERPEYLVIKGSGKPNPPRVKGPTLGFTPGYSEGANDPKGVPVEGVAEGRPAAKAGIKAGDVIVEVAGKSVSNIQTYMAVMAAQEPGRTIEVGILRGSKRLTLKVTLEGGK